jgi:hypothetical protein
MLSVTFAGFCIRGMRVCVSESVAATSVHTVRAMSRVRAVGQYS